jgi:hypothetical protein
LRLDGKMGAISTGAILWVLWAYGITGHNYCLCQTTELR